MLSISQGSLSKECVRCSCLQGDMLLSSFQVAQVIARNNAVLEIHDAARQRSMLTAACINRFVCVLMLVTGSDVSNI